MIIFFELKIKGCSDESYRANRNFEERDKY